MGSTCSESAGSIGHNTKFQANWPCLANLASIYKPHFLQIFPLFLLMSASFSWLQTVQEHNFQENGILWEICTDLSKQNLATGNWQFHFHKDQVSSTKFQVIQKPLVNLATICTWQVISCSFSYQILSSALKCS